MKRLLFLSLLFLIPSVARAQVPVVSVLPANCSVGQQVSFLGTVYTCTAIDTWTPGASSGSVSLPTTLSAPGVFTNTQMNENFVVQVGSVSGCSPSAIKALIGTSLLTDALSSTVCVPVGATNAWSQAIAGYAKNTASGSTCSLGTCRAVGVGAIALSTATAADVWGFNAISSSTSGSSASLFGAELDLGPTNAGDTVRGLYLGGSFAAQPSFAVGVELHADAPTVGKWQVGFKADTDGLVPNSANSINVGEAIDLEPSLSTAGSQNSNGIFFVAQASDNSKHTATLFSSVDSANNSILQVASPDSSSNPGRTSLIPLLGNHNFANGISGANLLTFGTVTLSGGTGSYTFRTPYLSAPFCAATDGTAAAAVKAVTSTTAVTFTGTTTDVINFVCGPLAN